MTVDERMRVRLKALLEQVERDLGRGWQTEFAHRVYGPTAGPGKQSSLSNWYHRSKDASLDSIADLAKRLRMDIAYFTEEDLGSRTDYTQWIGRDDKDDNEDGSLARTQGFQEFLATEQGRRCTPEEIATLSLLPRRFGVAKDPSVYVGLLALLRYGFNADEVQRTKDAAKAEAVERGFPLVNRGDIDPT